MEALVSDFQVDLGILQPVSIQIFLRVHKTAYFLNSCEQIDSIFRFWHSRHRSCSPRYAPARTSFCHSWVCVGRSTVQFKPFDSSRDALIPWFHKLSKLDIHSHHFCGKWLLSYAKFPSQKSNQLTESNTFIESHSDLNRVYYIIRSYRHFSSAPLDTRRMHSWVSTKKALVVCRHSDFLFS